MLEHTLPLSEWCVTEKNQEACTFDSRAVYSTQWRMHIISLTSFISLTLFWTGGELVPPPAGFLNIAQKPLCLGS